MTTFSTWTHPATGEVRIYLNIGQRTGSKVFVTEKAVDQFGYAYDITVQIPSGVYDRRDDLVNRAEKAINEAAGARIKTFAEVLALASE